MKAIVLAGGSGSRLFPISCGQSKAAVSLLGRPVLAWTADRLRAAGVDGLIMTLARGMEPPRPEELSLPVTVQWEDTPLGSAGAVRACAEQIGEEDFWVVCGDVVWDFDLSALRESHRRLRPPATLALCHSETPQRYGVAEADREGRVTSFQEKPPLEQCAATTVNTGIMLCSPELFSWLRAEDRDLGGEVLPRLAQANALRAVAVEGYWRDLGTPEDYLQGCADLLSGKCRTDRRAEPIRPGVWSDSPIPEGVELVPPCQIGRGVTLGRGSLVGPHVCLEDGVSIGDHSLVQRSVLQAGVTVGSRATLYGAVVCAGASLGHYTVLNEGSVVGADAQVGENGILMEGVQVGPGLTVPPSVRLTQSLREPEQAAAPSAAARPEPVLTVEDLLALGRRLGRCGTVGVGGAGFRGLLLARALGCGAAAEGGAVLFHDGTRPEQAAWLARYYGWPVSAFLDETGGVYLFNEAGETLTRLPEDQPQEEGSWDLLAGAAASYQAALAQAQAEERDRLLACGAFQPKKGLYFL